MGSLAQLRVMHCYLAWAVVKAALRVVKGRFFQSFSCLAAARQPQTPPDTLQTPPQPLYGVHGVWSLPYS